MTVRTVTSHVLNLHGAARVGDLVSFRLVDGTYSATEHVPEDSATASIDASGNISVSLYCPATYACIVASAMAFTFVLPDSTDTVTLESLHATGGATPTQNATLQTLLDTAAIRANNLSDLSSAATARTNLGVYSTAEAEAAVGTTNVLVHGVTGNGTTDDTAAMQALLDSVPAGTTLVIPLTAVCKLSGSGLTISKKLRLTGGGTLQLSGASTSAIICNLSGTIDGLEIDHLTLAGEALPVGSQAGIGCFSGQTITNAFFHDLTVKDINIGISCNADLGGSWTNPTVLRNTLSNITGIVSGSGYGIHLANAFGALVMGNHITDACRHSIYQAKGGQSVIIGNTIRGHRRTVAALINRASLSIQRSSNVLVIGNRFVDNYDCSIMVNEDSVAYDCNDITIIGNQISGRQNNTYDIIVGQEILPGTYRTTNVTIQGNRITSDAVTGGPNQAIMIFQGRKIRVQANDIHRTNVAAASGNRLMGIAHDSYTAVDDDCTEIVVNGNTFTAEGSDTTGTKGIVFGTVVCGGASSHALPNNSFVGITTPYSYVATLTNPNLIAGVDWSTLAGTTATMQALTGDVNLNIKIPHTVGGTGANGNLNYYDGGVIGGQLILKTSPNVGSRYFGLVTGSDVDGNKLPIRFFGRDTGGTGVNGFWLSNGTSAGWLSLGPGGAGTPTSPVQAMGAIGTPVAAKTTTYTLVATDSVVTGDTTGGAFTLTLPSAIACAGRHYTIKRINAGANTLTVGCTSTQTIDGATTQALTSQWQILRVVSDGANWLTV